jgi:hypothetical protein
MTFDATFKGMSSNRGRNKAGIAFDFAYPPNVSLDKIHAVLTGAQLSVVAEVLPKAQGADARGQQSMLEADHVFEATCDCDGYATKVKHLQAGLKFNRSAIDGAALEELSGRSGTLTVVRIGDAKAEKGGDDDGDGSDAAP